MPSRLRVRIGAALLVTVLAASAAACSSTTDGQPKPSSDGPVLKQALSRVTDTATTRHYLEFGQPQAALQANGGYLSSGAYQRAIGYGASDLYSSYRIIKSALGIDLTKATYAISAGQPPQAGGLIAGLRLAGVGAKLEALGAKKSGTTYRFRPDNRVAFDDKLGRAVPGVTTGLNVVELDGSELRHGPSTAAVGQLRASGSNVLDDAGIATVATCLNSPLAAVITDKLPAAGGGRLPPSLVPTPSPGVRMVGVGLSGKHGVQPTEQLCVAADSKAHASQLAASVKKALTTGTSLRTNQKWSQLLGQPAVAVDGTTVRATAQPVSASGGVLLQSLLTGDLPGISS